MWRLHNGTRCGSRSRRQSVLVLRSTQLRKWNGPLFHIFLPLSTLLVRSALSLCPWGVSVNTVGRPMRRCFWLTRNASIRRDPLRKCFTPPTLQIRFPDGLLPWLEPLVLFVSVATRLVAVQIRRPLLCNQNWIYPTGAGLSLLPCFAPPSWAWAIRHHQGGCGTVNSRRLVQSHHEGSILRSAAIKTSSVFDPFFIASWYHSSKLKWSSSTIN